MLIFGVYQLIKRAIMKNKRKIRVKIVLTSVLLRLEILSTDNDLKIESSSKDEII